MDDPIRPDVIEREAEFVALAPGSGYTTRMKGARECFRSHHTVLDRGRRDPTQVQHHH